MDSIMGSEHLTRMESKAQVCPAGPWFKVNGIWRGNLANLDTDALFKDMQRRISNHLFDLKRVEGHARWRLDCLENASKQSPYIDPVYASFPPNGN